MAELSAVRQELRSRNLSSSFGELQSPQRDEQKLAVPFCGGIRGGLRPGKKITIMGVVSADPDSFDISLTCGCADVALDMCVRFEEREILRNACVSDQWGDEERSIPYFPFIAEQPFRVEIHCDAAERHRHQTELISSNTDCKPAEHSARSTPEPSTWRLFFSREEASIIMSISIIRILAGVSS